MKSNKLFLKIFVLLLAMPVIAEETRVPCIKKDGTIGFNVFDKFDCSLMKKVVESPEIKKAHQDKLNSKLAERLIFKIERKLEEISTIDKYFNKLELEFTKSEKVKRSCTLEVIATPTCTGKTNFNKKNYEILLSKISSEGETLPKKMLNLFNKSRGINRPVVNSCPLKSPSGYYTLDGLFDDFIVRQLKDNLEKDRGSRGVTDYLETAYSKYPQLTLINKADLGDGKFKKKFEEYVLKTPNSGSVKAHLLGFFAEKANQEMLSTGLENSCSDLRKNIDKFICSPADEMMASEDTAYYLFEGEEDIEDSVTVTNAYLCGISDVEVIEKKDKAGELLDDFKSNVVKQLQMGNDKKARVPVDNFCDIYSCRSEKVKVAQSCQSGGPVSAKDLKEIFKCVDGEQESETCRSDVKQALTYLQSIDTVEIDKQNIEHARSLGLSIPVEQGKKSNYNSDYSTFLQNFIGVEGTLRAEGKLITNDTVAEKLREFAERKIDPIPQQNKDIIMANNEGNKVFNMIKEQKQNEVLQQQALINQQVMQNTLLSPQDNESKRQAIVANTISKFSKSENQLNKRGDFETSNDHERANEIKRMRSELENVVNGMKGTESERLQTISDSNTIYAKSKNENLKDPSKTMSKEEQERLDAYRASLNSWESRLRNRETDLIDREFRNSTRSIANDSNENLNDSRLSNSHAKQTDTSTQTSAGNGTQNAQALKLVKGQSGSNTEKESSGEKGQFHGQETDMAIVSAENLATLEKSVLKKLGIDKDSFVIKVRLMEKIYDVPVKSFTHNGKAMYVPLLNNENRDLAKLILESPLFSDYRQYQQQRERL